MQIGTVPALSLYKGGEWRRRSDESFPQDVSEMEELMLVTDITGEWGPMESNCRYYQRRANEELRAASRAITPEAQARRQALAASFAKLAEQYQAGLTATMAHG